jgi:hypothetical protein
MLGPPKPRRLDEPIAVSLDDLVPTDKYVRNVSASRPWPPRPATGPVVGRMLAAMRFLAMCLAMCSKSWCWFWDLS